MPSRSFAPIRSWVFDLDNTLYPPGNGLFTAIEARMNAFVARELGLNLARASALRERYWRQHGTTLAGLMAEHGVAPDPYLAEVHDVDYSVLPPDPALAAALAALPGRRYVFTNGSRAHAQNVLKARELSGAFDAVFGIEDAGYTPKPAPAAYDRLVALAGLDPQRTAFFEDDPVNLVEPRRRGMTTVLVGVEGRADHHTADLAGFLRAIV
jgi:putative hydrolase of the HAD superfamily